MMDPSMLGSPPPGMGLNGPPEESQEAAQAEDPDQLVSDAVELLQKAIQLEKDDADSAALGKAINLLYTIKSSRQDAEISAAGGNPKQMRALGRKYA